MGDRGEGDCVQDVAETSTSSSEPSPVDKDVPGKEKDVSMFMPPDRSSIKGSKRDGLNSCLPNESGDPCPYVINDGEMGDDGDETSNSQQSSDVSRRRSGGDITTEEVGEANIIGDVGMEGRDIGEPGVEGPAVAVSMGRSMHGRSGRENRP